MENATSTDVLTAMTPTKITCVHLKEEWYDTRATYVTNIALVVMNLLTAVSATVGNFLILLAVHRTPSLRIPSNTLVCCLAVADFLVGLIVQPINAMQIIFEIKHNVQAFCVAKLITTGSLSWICAGVSFLVISAISVERFLAIKLHLRYASIVTVRRVLLVVSLFWLICTVLVLAWFLGASYDTLVLVVVAMDIACMTITITAYFKIYLLIRELHRKTKDQSAHLTADLKTFKRSAVTMLYIVSLFLACFIPFLTVLVARKQRGGGPTLNIFYNVFATVVYLSSSLNPFVYCYRLKEIRVAVFKILGRRYTIDTNGEVVPLSRTRSISKTNNLKNSLLTVPPHIEVKGTRETNV